MRFCKCGNYCDAFERECPSCIRQAYRDRLAEKDAEISKLKNENAYLFADAVDTMAEMVIADPLTRQAKAEKFYDKWLDAGGVTPEKDAEIERLRNSNKEMLDLLEDWYSWRGTLSNELFVQSMPLAKRMCDLLQKLPLEEPQKTPSGESK